MENVFSKLESFKLPSYLPVSGNYHLNKPLKLSRLHCNFAFFHVTGCLFPRKSRKSSPHCSCMNLLLHHKLICICFILFWMNIIKKGLYEYMRFNWNIFKYFYNSFLGESPRNTHQKTIAVPRYGHGTLFH